MRTPLTRSCHGFTLVEIAVAVTIIGLLAAIAVPAYSKLKERSINTLMGNEIRAAAGALNYYAFEKGHWPPDGDGGWPSELTGYLPPPDRWNRPTPIGGNWMWSLNSDEAIASLRVNNYVIPQNQMVNLDRMIDNGDVGTGGLFVSGTALVYVLEK
ncbi:MAG: pulG 1 [Rariglobus sp.]|nr:pulG 1 [Rariglobus sp.]